MSDTPPAPTSRLSILDWIERIGNRLPEPALLFAMLAGLVIVASAVGSSLGWTVRPMQPRVTLVDKVDESGAPVLGDDGAPERVPLLDARGKPKITLVAQLNADGTPVELRPVSLLTVDGIYWMLSSMIRNFTTLPALGLVFVAMLGIGVAEKFGLFSALMRFLALITPKSLLTPVVVFVGANAAVASDAGYIILPPLAAGLYLAAGRSPIAGLAAAFAGVAGGFGGGFFPNAADGFLAGEATRSAHIIDANYATVTPLHNWYFKIASSIVVTLAGWLVTDLLVEPRLRRAGHEASGDAAPDAAPHAEVADVRLTRPEINGLLLALASMVAVVGIFAAMIAIEGAPLHGRGQPTLASGAPAPGEREGDRWSHVIVPLIFFAFMIPGIVYGITQGVLRTQRDFIEAIYHGIRTIVPVLTIAFFMGQFVNYFSYAGLDKMLAFAGGSLLVHADLPTPLLLILFVLLVVAGDFAISGMLSKYGILAPIFIPMFMMVGISPELTTAAYRIGDSVVNIVTPLNTYLLIILVVLQKYRRHAGLGTLIALMLPYSIVFFVIWTSFLMLWWMLDLPLGPGAPLTYVPPH
ncbi:MAG: AbgT family transporter [Phycisphaerae bacterium]|nr:AbgT family transporter [Phycisphaerae bacterium]